MKKINVLILSVGLTGFGTVMNSAFSQSSQNENVPAAGAPSGDAVQNAQTVREVPPTRPEQKKMNTTVPTCSTPRMRCRLPRLSIINQTRERCWGSISFATP